MADRENNFISLVVYLKENENISQNLKEERARSEYINRRIKELVSKVE